MAWQTGLCSTWLGTCVPTSQGRVHANLPPEVKSWTKGLLAHLIIVPAWVLPPGQRNSERTCRQSRRVSTLPLRLTQVS